MNDINVGLGFGGNSLQPFSPPFGSKGGFTKEDDGWGKDDGFSKGRQIIKQVQGQKRVISRSSTTKTQILNGVKKTVKVTKIKYSDGTEETEETISD